MYTRCNDTPVLKLHMSSDLRSRKRVAMRDKISDVATRLFKARGFDQVTVDEIALAADVGRKTVFNHFPRKEDLFFDRVDEIKEALVRVLIQRPSEVAALDAYQIFAHQLIEQESPYLTFSSESRAFVETIERSETLKARAREIRGELARVMALTLMKDAGMESDDPDANLAANLLVTTWTVARMQGHQTYLQTDVSELASAAFLAIIDKAAIGLRATFAGTPYI